VQNNLNIPKMATIIETAEITGLAKYHIRQLTLQGKIKHIRAGKKILINIEKLIEYLNSGENVPVAHTEKQYRVRTARG